MSKKWNQLERLDHKALKKLQADRERAAKLAVEAEQKKYRMIIGVSVLFVIVILFSFIFFLRNRAISKEFAEERSKLLFSQVANFKGKIEHRYLATWERLKEKFDFDRNYSFRTFKDSNVAIQMQLDNQVKLFPESEMGISPPVLFEKENKVKKESVTLKRGELTAAVSLDGREIMEIEVAGVIIKGASGLFKIIYDAEKDRGEVVVKNGVVEVSRKSNKTSRPIRISGFYKIIFSSKELGKPSQASVIQYDWR